MGAIVGAISERRRIDEGLVCQALTLIKHRGPHGQEIVSREWGLLGVNLLKLSGQSQTIIAKSKEARVYAALDGTILNSSNIRDQLRSRGEVSQSNSGVDVILKAYVENGIEAVSEIIGHVCLAIIDAKRKKLFLVRDRLGVRPLYYLQAKEVVFFASEIKAILALNPAPPEVNNNALVDYLTFQYSLDEKTLFSGIKKVQPGCYLEWDYGSVGSPTEKRYSQLDFAADFNHTERYFIEKTRSLIEDSVKLNIAVVDSLGTYLSGGLDSSTVVSFLARLKKPDAFRTFCGKYLESKEYDESRYARIVAKAAGSTHSEIVIHADEFPDLIKKIVFLMDEPQAGPGVYGQYIVAREAAKHVNVALSGEGGDEVFLGYAKYLIAYLEECIRGAIFETANHREFVVTLQSIAGSLPLLKSYTGMLQGFWQEGLFNSKENRYFDLCNRIRDIDRLVSPDVFDDAYDVQEVFLGRFTADGLKSHVNMMSRFDILTGLQGVLQVDDRTSMAHGIENRPPLMDHRIVQLIASAPPKMKFLGGKQKYLLRKAIKGIVPKEILARKDKMGFPVPMNEWLAGPLRDFVHDILLSKSSRERGIFTEKGLTELLKPRTPYGRSLWGALNLELWFQTFIDKKQNP
jgi:asparagine synthase (glutamine-hydrolysing)